MNWNRQRETSVREGNLEEWSEVDEWMCPARMLADSVLAAYYIWAAIAECREEKRRRRREKARARKKEREREKKTLATMGFQIVRETSRRVRRRTRRRKGRKRERTSAKAIERSKMFVGRARERKESEEWLALVVCPLWKAKQSRPWCHPRQLSNRKPLVHLMSKREIKLSLLRNLSLVTTDSSNFDRQTDRRRWLG